MPEPTTPTALPPCPSCGGAMVIREGARGKFAGCTNFRSGCRGTRELPTSAPAQASLPQTAPPSPKPASRPAPDPADTTAGAVTMQLTTEVRKLTDAVVALTERIEGLRPSRPAAAAEEEVDF